MFKWLYKKKPVPPQTQVQTQDQGKEPGFILVKTITINSVRAGAKEGTLYLYLFESEDGRRKLEHKITIQASNNFDAIPLYAETIYPWLKGKEVDDIPSYWDIIKERRPDDIKRMYDRFFTK